MPEYLWVNNTRSIRRALSGRSGYPVVRTAGFSIPDLDHLTARAPQQHGATYIDTFFRPRRLSLTVAMVGCDEAELQAKHRELIRALNPLDDGELRIWAEDETRYTLTCRPSTAVELRLLDSRTAEALIQLQADDPFFYTAAQGPIFTIVSVVSSGLQIPFTIPAKISSSTNEATTTMTNGGHVLTWPTLTVWHPFVPITNMTFINDTTGEQLYVQTTMPPNNRLVVDMGARTVRNSTTGENLLGAATGTFWPLEVGANSIRVTEEGVVAFGLLVRHADRFLAVV